MKTFLLSLILLFISFTGFAKRTLVSTATEINNTFWMAGDTIVMRNGTWINQAISLRADGTVDQPIVLMAESSGNVVLTGTSKMAFAGKYLVINGLYFKDGTLSGSDVISFRTSSSSLAENCRVSNCVIENYNPSLNTVDSKWVSIYGKNNQVDHCSFINKSNSGTLLVVWLVSGTTPNHIIADNYFGFRNANLDSYGNELNGQEIIRIGDSSTSMQEAGVQVTGNYFEHCNGEIEVISNKSCGNYYLNNIFFECAGMLTLRHGNNCTVDGNYFIGNGVANTGGVRIIGENHKVYNNYFENLTGTSYRAALCIVRGKENSALNEYFQVKNALVAFNTMVNCTQSFSINYNSSSLLNMPPIGTTIAHNHVYNTSSSKTNVIIYLINVAAMDVSWKNNLMNQGLYTNFAYTAEQVITGVDPDMALAGTTPEMYEPESGTGLTAYTTSDYSEIDLDIRGRDRTSLKLPGASQISGIVSRIAPQKDSVGAYFLRFPTSAIHNIKSNFLKVYSYRNQLITDVPVPGELVIYDLTGRLISMQKISEGVTRNTISQNGIYIVIFKTKQDEKMSRKVVICNN
ncbi:MAG: T9SS type A sorting domain-containing protein [Bacteroidales bacterium]|jgi:poly(beta-D-mannuronate) lyase|nr:T9SS type A sorting domain-containing protein [Bacteroidales bacterium]